MNLRGLAMLVPLIELVATFEEPIHADVMLEPGANMSTQLPWLLNDDSMSELVVEPTVITVGSDAGEKVHASTLSFPAATTTTIPASTAFFTAVF
jgi:hypothetical protein